MRALQGLKEPRFSGDDSGLKNVWDEVCVQIQYEQSAFWDAYEHAIASVVTGGVDRLAPFEREAIWLQTPEGERWEGEDEAARDSSPVLSRNVVDHVVREFVYAEAGRWSNSHIKQFLGRSSD